MDYIQNNVLLQNTLRTDDSINYMHCYMQVDTTIRIVEDYVQVIFYTIKRNNILQKEKFSRIQDTVINHGI